MKKPCPYYFDLKRFFNKQLIATNHVMQNSKDLGNTLGIIKNRCQVNPVNDIDFNKKDFLIYYLNDDSNSDRDRKKNDDLEDLRPGRVD